ncbi:MAG TPA: polysaccharide deacetylase family protein, partial [Bacteroidales bacterium]|nr:polysaccharide deacetylase family protein [Bacteroidales bacterium]
SNLLFENEIDNGEVSTIEFEGSKALFPVKDEKSFLPFDPFAASFYLLSRYEEYLPHKKDEHGRFHAHESIAWKNRFLKKPVVNIWAYHIKKILQKRFPGLKFKKRKFKFIPTYDIDIAFSYRSKGFVRTTGGYLNDLYRGQWKNLVLRTKAITGASPDPYDTFSYQINLHKRFNLNAIYFFLFGNYSRYDKNISVNNKRYQHLIKHISDYAQVGVHPSYVSQDDFDQLKKEVSKLSTVLKREIKDSRQHYLRLDLPTTYRNLQALEITNDYTMGYAAEPGFRAGTCDPFYFYDLDLEIETKLRVHPFTIMDGTLIDYQKIKPQDAKQVIKPLIEEVKAVDGTFISLWHNHSLNPDSIYGNWREVYEELVEIALGMEKEDTTE